ncbi:MAG TPA: hypothetical protein ENH84_01265, partial [Phycisphaerae bacterium]|nr:hypothetical protein [Phycisphaerae bacterium]
MADKRTRPRKEVFRLGEERRKEIVNRVKEFRDADMRARSGDIEKRIQRYAKYRMWTEGKDWPWPNSSDAAIPDMMTHSLRMQDTLHNAVMSRRPVVGSKATLEHDRDKEEVIDKLIDHQVFVEQDGERIVGDIAEAFVNDGHFTAYIPWIKETRETMEVRRFGPIPEELEPREHFFTLMSNNFPDLQGLEELGGGWEWRAFPKEGEPFRISFFTTPDEQVEMVVRREVQVYDGPRIIVKDYEEVLHPQRVMNLQAPSPSNPHGAPHVILVDNPTVDEIKRLAKSGFYDLMTGKDIEALENLARDDSEGEDRKKATDTMQGADASPSLESSEAKSHRRLTRLLCFDVFDIDNDGIDEDVIWWVILEADVLVRAKMLTEVFPSNPPKRPFAEEQFVPVPGYRTGIGLLEMLEGLHDDTKILVDQTIDYATIRNSPFGFYRASGGIRPETIAMHPGELYPLSNPKQDIEFPNLGSSSTGEAINLMGLFTQAGEKLSMIGDLQLGRVPAGKSSALRTVGGQALIAGQGEARPERILRRFFLGLVEIWKRIHGLNQHFLPEEKKFRIIGIKSADPYIKTGREGIEGAFQFDFQANVLNTTKNLLQQNLMTLTQVYVSELMVQLGILQPDGFFRLMKDLGEAFGQDPDQYLTAPSPDSMKPKILAEEALSAIVNGEIPDGVPAEGAQAHLEALANFTETDEFGLLQQESVDILKAYMQEVQERVQFEARQAQILEATRNFGQHLGPYENVRLQNNPPDNI